MVKSTLFPFILCMNFTQSETYSRLISSGVESTAIQQLLPWEIGGCIAGRIVTNQVCIEELPVLIGFDSICN